MEHYTILMVTRFFRVPKLVALLYVLCFVHGCNPQSNCEALTVKFGKDNLHFPSLVEKAVEAYNLSFIPPAFYYKTDSLSFEMILGYDSDFGDFDNDRQAKEALYSRCVHTYLFQFRAGENTYDSLKHEFEKSYKKKFVLTKGMKTWNFFSEKENRPFEANLMKINDCLTVGIAKGNSSRQGKVVNVHVMYGLSLGDIGVQMGGW